MPSSYSKKRGLKNQWNSSQSSAQVGGGVIDVRLGFVLFVPSYMIGDNSSTWVGIALWKRQRPNVACDLIKQCRLEKTLTFHSVISEQWQGDSGWITCITFHIKWKCSVWMLSWQKVGTYTAVHQRSFYVSHYVSPICLIWGLVSFISWMYVSCDLWSKFYFQLKICHDVHVCTNVWLIFVSVR